MQRKKITHNNVTIESVSLSETAKNITHRNILLLVDGVETYNYTHSLAAAKKIIDAFIAYGVLVQDGRLVLTSNQFCNTVAVFEFTKSYTVEEIGQILSVK